MSKRWNTYKDTGNSRRAETLKTMNNNEDKFIYALLIFVLLYFGFHIMMGLLKGTL
jgi:hypothetical protein